MLGMAGGIWHCGFKGILKVTSLVLSIVVTVSTVAVGASLQTLNSRIPD